MDDEDRRAQNQQAHTPRIWSMDQPPLPQSQQTKLSQPSSESPTTQSESSPNTDKPRQSYVLVFVVGGLLVVILAISIGTLLALQKGTNIKNDTNKSSSTSNSLTQGQINSSQTNNSNSTQNPSYNSSAVSAEGKYCSNAINAEIAC